MTIPSEGELHIEIGWLAGIIDGEGSIVMYNAGTFKQIRVYIINTDIAILEKALVILTKLGVMAYTYQKTANKRQRDGSYDYTKPCFEIIVSRREDLRALLPIIANTLVGDKKAKALRALSYLQEHPFNAGRKTPRVTTERLAPTTNLERFRMKLQSALTGNPKKSAEMTDSA